MGRQVTDPHAVDARRPLVPLDLRQCLLQVRTLDNRFHRRSNQGRPAFDIGSRRARFGPLGGGAQGFTLRPDAQVQLDLILLPHGSREIAVLPAIPPFRPSADAPAYYALC
ncbi:MAG: hypothetical protein WB646_01885 [Steroidobacteraceae bacterium]